MANTIESMASKSYWLQTAIRSEYPTLKEDMDIEVAVVGAGIAGILTAYHLQQEGKKVALFERFRILNGTTGNTTAKLSAQHGLIYQNIAERYNENRAKMYYQANMRGIEEIKNIGKNLNLKKIVTDETTYAYTTDKKKVAAFKKEKELYDELGISGDFLEDTPLGFKIETALSMKNQGIFHPVLFLNAVLEAAVEKGLLVYEHTPVTDMKKKKNQHVLICDNDHEITCDHVVFTTHYPLIEKDKHYTQLWGRTTQTLAYKTDKKLFEGAHIAYDTPSVTLRTMEYFGDHFFLIGGQTHETGDGYSDEERYEAIHRLAQKLFSVEEPVFKWSTHDLISKDKIPFIGKLHPDVENAYTITGLNAWGLANSSVGALVITDLICGRENPYVEMYDPFRKIPKLKSDDEDQEFSTKVNKVTKVNLENLKKDQQTTIKVDDEEVGVYKDKNGKLHYFSLSCTHKGCDLRVNDGDKTWDCSCHGSRFDKFGNLIYGPAIENMEKVQKPKG